MRKSLKKQSSIAKINKESLNPWQSLKEKQLYKQFKSPRTNNEEAHKIEQELIEL